MAQVVPPHCMILAQAPEEDFIVLLLSQTFSLDLPLEQTFQTRPSILCEMDLLLPWSHIEGPKCLRSKMAAKLALNLPFEKGKTRL